MDIDAILLAAKGPKGDNGDPTLSADLASTDPGKGAELVGFKQEGVGAVERSVADKLRENASLSDYAIGDGVADDTDALEYFLSEAVGVVRIPRNSTFVISRSLTISNPLLAGLVGDCPETSRLKFTGSGRLQFVQGIVELPAMETEFTVSGKSEIYLSEAPEAVIENGDVIILWNPDPYSLNPEREYYHDGCMAQVNRLEGNKILTFGKVAKINESTIRLFCMKRRSFMLKDFAFDTGGISNAIRVSHYVGVRISNLTSLDSGGPLNIKLDKCFDVHVEFSKVTATTDNAYPIQIANCQNFVIIGATCNSSRHGIGLGGDGFLASAPPRNGLIQGCTLLNYQPDGVGGVGVSAADAHSNIIDVTYKDCFISSSATLNGKNLKYVDCIIESFTTPDAGRCASGSAPMSGELSFTRCRFDVTRRVVTSDSGVIRVNPYYEQNESITLKIKDCSINFVDDSTNNTVYPFVRVIKGANKNKMNLVIDGLSVRGAKLKYNELIRVDYWQDPDPDPDALLFIEIKNVDGVNYNQYCTGFSNDSNVKFRIKGWSYRGTLPLVSGETESNITVDIPIIYPGVPSVNATTVGNPGANQGWVLLCRGFTNSQATVYARTLSGTNLFTGDMHFQLDSSLMEY